MMTTNQRERTVTSAYEQWVKSLGVPVHEGYYSGDLMTVELGRWEERGCNAAFLLLFGQKGVSETRIMGIPPGKTTLPWRFALDEIYYVLEGKGLTTVWSTEHGARKTFEWQKNSLFMIPRQSFRQLTNAQGDKPARLLAYNYLPFVMEAVEDPAFFFNNPYVLSQGTGSGELYSEAKQQPNERGGGSRWHGNFFPDMKAWDKLDPFRERGAGGHVVWISFPNSPHAAHMSVFPSRTYKKAHRHGPGTFIVIPAGEGYSFLWEEGKEKIFCPWHEASCFSPGYQWFHQHFNVGATPARYLAIGRPQLLAFRDQPQIEYPDEDPWIRQNFEKELAKRGLTSLMPDEIYKDRNYQWGYAEDKE